MIQNNNQVLTFYLTFFAFFPMMSNKEVTYKKIFCQNDFGKKSQPLSFQKMFRAKEKMT